MAWPYLVGAILTEVTATLALRASENFSRPGYVVVLVLGYAAAFAFLGQALERGMSIGVAYGIWSAVGVAIVAVMGKVLFDDGLSALTGVGIAIIIAGVLVVELAGGEH